MISLSLLRFFYRPPDFFPRPPIFFLAPEFFSRPCDFRLA